ncbi:MULTISPECIES: hypothetical protein [Bacillaceae]|uniref:hypothetical protein n=1 Tax=Bacillaceae TaxID=186817 RepID=UPI000BFCE127|nr:MULTISPECIES: hypothetical protein [Bacillaceae]MBY0155431.1 hypothetical protein [Cytobacillus firmus]MCM3032548.1 septation ring formation regulator EzrA [Niallia sp. MER 6]PGT80971.1 hypothetical protein COD11_19170 [Bacillus sp. AFS040349]
MAKKFHEIPTMEEFLKGLEKIRSQQLEARESSKLGVYPFEGTDNQFSHYATGIVTPKGKHYLIDGEGDLSFTGTKYLAYEDKEAFPPFSAAELLLESKNDFKIDYAEAVKYYNLNKELAIKENENILSSKEFKPDHPIALTVNQEMKEVKNMLEEQGLDPSKNPEVSALLDHHFSKLEKLLSDFSEKIEKASHEDIPQLEENMKGKLNKIFTDLKDGLKQLFVDIKDNVRSGIENKVNDVKINIHNAVAEKVQNVNDKIKNLSASLDKKYQIIEKEPEASALSQVQKAFDEVKEAAKTEAAKIKAGEVSQSLADMSPIVGNLENQNKQLKKENEGLKTFVNVVKSKHPEVYQSIYNTMKGVQIEPKQEQNEIKTKVKELELSI